MIEAPDLVLEGEDDFAGTRIEYLLKAELFLDIGAHQHLLGFKLPIHLPIAGDVDRHVVRVVDGLVVWPLDEVEMLVGAGKKDYM